MFTICLTAHENDRLQPSTTPVLTDQTWRMYWDDAEDTFVFYVMNTTATTVSMLTMEWWDTNVEPKLDKLTGVANYVLLGEMPSTTPAADQWVAPASSVNQPTAQNSTNIASPSGIVLMRWSADAVGARRVFSPQDTIHSVAKSNHWIFHG